MHWRAIPLALGLFALALGLFSPAPVAHAAALSAPSGYVTDAANILSAGEKSSLERKLAALDASTTEQIAVVTVPDMGGDYIEHYAADLFQRWGIGHKSRDNGVLLLLSMQERAIRIEVGYGLEGALPDSVASRIIRERMTPLMRAGNYDAAVQAGVDGIGAAIQGEYAGAGDASAGGSSGSGGIDPFGAFIFGLFALQWTAAFLGRTKSWWLGGVVGAVAGALASTFFGWWVFDGALLTAALGAVGLAFDYAASRAFSSGSYAEWNPWIGGGGWGGRGGFGGFGGGSSGGGGASGGW